MGGGLTLAIGPRHLDTFSRLAVFSSGAGQNPEKTLADIGANAKNVNAQLKLFWIGVGTEDGAMAGAKRASDFFNVSGHQAHVQNHVRARIRGLCGGSI